MNNGTVAAHSEVGNKCKIPNHTTTTNTVLRINRSVLYKILMNFIIIDNLCRILMEADESLADRTYLQCRTARRLAEKGTCRTHDITSAPDPDPQPNKPTIIGDLLPEDKYSFRGSRVMHAGQIVNQSICLSFDPSNMNCLACHKEHSVTGFVKPAVVGVSDQNFVTSVTGGEMSSCIAIVRLEDGDLHDLTTLTFKIFERQVVMSGSVFLLGSASHLARVGPTGYAVDWTKCVQRFKSKWPDVLLMPLFPIPSAECNTGLARELKELSVWFETMYMNTPHGLRSALSYAVAKISEHSRGCVTLPAYEHYTVSFPKDMVAQSPLIPFHFRTNSSRPTGLSALDCKAANELVRALIINLNSDLHLGISLEIDHLSVPFVLQDESTKDTCKEMVVIGASHMSRTVGCLDPRHVYPGLGRVSPQR